MLRCVTLYNESYERQTQRIGRGNKLKQSIKYLYKPQFQAQKGDAKSVSVDIKDGEIPPQLQEVFQKVE